MIIMIKTKTDLGSDEFKVIREISLAHPRLQKKERYVKWLVLLQHLLQGFLH